MKKIFLLTLAVSCFLNCQAQNDTAYFDDGSMVIGKGGIKVSIEDGNIVIDGSGITDFVPVDTITSWESEPCEMSSFDPKTGIGISCAVFHPRSEVRYQVLRNGAGVTKEVRIEDEDVSSTQDAYGWGTGVLYVDDSTFVRKTYHPGSFELVIDPQDTIVVDPAEPSNELQEFRNGQWRKIEEQ